MTRALLNPRQEAHFLRNVRVTESGCWEWTKVLSADGYPLTGQRIGGQRLTRFAYRLAYIHWVGEIPAGYQLDHVCHSQALAAGSCRGGKDCMHRRCVNPAHLEPVTVAENARRNAHSMKERCPQGHTYDKENTYVGTDGRACRVCQRAHQRAYKVRKTGGAWGLPYKDRTHCPYGHPYDEVNTYMHDGKRSCRTCMKHRHKEWRARQRPA